MTTGSSEKRFLTQTAPSKYTPKTSKSQNVDNVSKITFCALGAPIIPAGAQSRLSAGCAWFYENASSKSELGSESATIVVTTTL